MLNRWAFSLKSEQLQLDIHQNPLLNWDLSGVACCRWLPNAWLHCKPFFSTETLQAGYALPFSGHFFALHTCVWLLFSPPSLKYTAVTDLVSLDAWASLKRSYAQLLSITSLLLLMQEQKDDFVHRKTAAKEWNKR